MSIELVERPPSETVQQSVWKDLQRPDPDMSPYQRFNRLAYNYLMRSGDWKPKPLKLEDGVLERGRYQIPYGVRGSYGRVRAKRETLLALDLPGGPGTPLNQQWRSNASPEIYRVATANWRGVGDTTPFGEVNDNSTDLLVEDLDVLRRAASQGGDDPVVIRGASWGMTMAILYTTAYPEKVAGLVLGLPFLAAQADIEHNYARSGALAQRYPFAFDAFSTALGGKDGQEAVRMLADELGSKDERRVRKALLTAASWEYARNGETFRLTEEQIDLSRPEVKQLSARARILNHYTAENFFLPSDGVASVFNSIPKEIPITVLAHKDDPLGTPETLDLVKSGLPQAEIHVYDANWHWIARENESPAIGFDNSFITQGYSYAMTRTAFVLSGRLEYRPGVVNYPRPCF